MKPSWIVRAVLVVLLTGLAGVLSSLLSMMSAPVYGVRSALFGATLGLGVLLTGWLGRERLRNGAYPGIGLSLGVAVLTGSAAAAILAVHAHAFPLRPAYDFPPPQYLTGGRLWAVSIVYAILLHGLYCARGSVRRPTLVVLSGAVIAGVLAGALRVALTSGGVGWDRKHIDEAIALSLFAGPPFCLLWMLAVRCADPAWSPARMQAALIERPRQSASLHFRG